MKQVAWVMAATSVLAASAFAAGPSTRPATSQPASKPANAAVVAVPRDAGWVKRHEGFVAEAKKGTAEVVFLGDSITDGWAGAGRNVWAEQFAPMKALNIGISGDRTEHVLWRLQHGTVEGLRPKVVVLMIGTNNIKQGGLQHGAEQVAEGVAAVVEELRTRLPEAKILVLGVFPRQPQYEWIAGVIKGLNGRIAKLADGEKVRFLDIGEKFRNEKGELTKEIMPDLLHLSPKGYEIWAQAILPTLGEMMGEKVKK